MTNERLRVKGEFIKLLLLEDLRDYDPSYDPYVYIARSHLALQNLDKITAQVKEFIGVRSGLVSIDAKDRCLGQIEFQDLDFIGNDYFEDGGKYVTGEEFEKKGISLEIVYRERRFEGLDLSYYEPSDRLITYLRLHREMERTWINPYTRDIVIRSGDGKILWDPHDEFLAVRESELRDYLAARERGLLIVRYSERILETHHALEGLPAPFQRPTKHGRQAWIIDKAPLNPDQTMYFSRLWEAFWISPASKPQRWDAEIRGEFKGSVLFILRNGEQTSYGSGRDSYFEIISFRSTLLRSLIGMPHNRIHWASLTLCDLMYADGSHLPGCINTEGQFQSFFGLIAKLDVGKQRHIAAYSEPWKGKPSREFIQVNIDAEFPKTRPLAWTISKVLAEANGPWQDRFGETLLLTPPEDGPLDIMGPTTFDFEELADKMLELQKLIIPEDSIDTVKNGVDLSSLASSPEAYNQIRSIGYVRLLFRRFPPETREGSADVLSLVNELRNCKGHPKNIGPVLERFKLTESTPRAAYLEVLRRLAEFLTGFRIVTEKALDVVISPSHRDPTEDPWYQLNIATRYFASGDLVT